MANKKITELPAATLPIASGVKFEAVQGGINVQVDADDMPGSDGTWGSITGTLSDQTDLQAALDGKETAGAASTVQTNLTNHINDTSDAHDASAISFSATGGISATDVQAALAELDSEKQTSAQVSTAISTATVGVQDLFVLAAAMEPRTTNGSSTHTKIEFATSIVNLTVLAFDQTTQEFAQFSIVPPRKWNNGTITVVPYWTALSGSGTVRWAINGGVYRNDDALTTALGTAQNSDDTLIATSDLHIGPETSAITLAGTGQDANLLVLQIARDPANDTLTADALLIGISVRFTCDAAKDA